jgi:hypothetical protein
MTSWQDKWKVSQLGASLTSLIGRHAQYTPPLQDVPTSFITGNSSIGNGRTKVYECDRQRNTVGHVDKAFVFGADLARRDELRLPGSFQRGINVGIVVGIDSLQDTGETFQPIPVSTC